MGLGGLRGSWPSLVMSITLTNQQLQLEHNTCAHGDDLTRKQALGEGEGGLRDSKQERDREGSRSSGRQVNALKGIDFRWMPPVFI